MVYSLDIYQINIKKIYNVSSETVVLTFSMEFEKKNTFQHPKKRKELRKLILS